MPRGGLGRGAALAVGGIVFAVALLCRLANLGEALTAEGVRLPPFDESYHALRILNAGTGFPLVGAFDPGRGESGAFCPWPPLWDAAAASGARLLGGTTPEGLLLRAALLPPILFSAFAGGVGALLARRRGVRPALAAGLSIALSPFLLEASSAGSIDHHFLEPVAAFAVAAALLSVVASDARSGAVRSGLLLGSALLAALLVQTALLLLAALVLAALLLLPPAAVWPRAAGALGFAVAAGGVAAYAAAQAPGYPLAEWFLGVPHAAALLGASAAAGVSAVVCARGLPRWRGAALASALGGLTALAIPGAATPLLLGSRFLGGDPWLDTIVEFGPLFLPPFRSPSDDFLRFGGAALAALPFLVTARRHGSPRRLSLAVLASGLLLAALGSGRFAVLALPFLAVAGALALDDLSRSGRRAGAALVAALLVLPAAAGAVPRLLSPAPLPGAGAEPYLRAASFLRSRPGPGRVLGPWSWGHLLRLASGRPVVVDGFGAMPGRVPFENALSALLAVDEATVADYVERTGVRWIVLDNPLLVLPRYAETVGRDPRAYLRPGPEEGDAPRVTRLAQSTFWWRAYFLRGAGRPGAGPFGRELSRFRLVHEDPARSGPAPWEGPALQVWERVDP